jgi:hypothetical protein
MANAFVNVYTISDSDDKTTVWHRHGICNTIIRPFSIRTCKFVFHYTYKCFSNLNGPNYFCKCFDIKLWNRSFGTETPSLQLLFENKTLFRHFMSMS